MCHRFLQAVGLQDRCSGFNPATSHEEANSGLNLRVFPRWVRIDLSVSSRVSLYGACLACSSLPRPQQESLVASPWCFRIKIRRFLMMFMCGILIFSMFLRVSVVLGVAGLEAIFLYECTSGEQMRLAPCTWRKVDVYNQNRARFSMYIRGNAGAGERC